MKTSKAKHQLNRKPKDFKEFNKLIEAFLNSVQKKKIVNKNTTMREIKILVYPESRKDMLLEGEWVVCICVDKEERIPAYYQYGKFYCQTSDIEIQNVKEFIRINDIV